MSAKLIFVLATAFLLVQYSCGKAVPNFKDSQCTAEHVLEEDTKDSLLVAEPKKLPEKLEHFLKIEGIKFFKAFIRLSKKFTEKWLSLLTPGDYEDEQDKLVVEATKKYVKEIDSLLSRDDEEWLGAKDEEFKPIIDNALNFAFVIIPAAFKENLLGNLVETIVATVKFVHELDSDVETYWDSLSAQEKEEQADFGHWLKRFSEEVNPVTKLQLVFNAVKDNEFSFTAENELEEDALPKFIYKQLNKLSAIGFEILAENFSKLVEDLSALEEKDEELTEDIEQISNFVSNLKAVEPDFMERLAFLQSNNEFLNSAIELLIESMKKNIADPRAYAIAKLSPFVQELIDEGSKLDLPQKSPLQKLVIFFKTVKEEPDNDKKIKLTITFLAELFAGRNQ